MLSRGFHDALALWPTAAWAILASSMFWAFLRLCQISRQRYGFSVLNGRRATDFLTAWVYLPAASLLEGVMHLYLLWAIGWMYALVLLPVFVLGWMTLPALLDDMRPAMVLLPAVHLGLTAALVVLLGFADIGLLRSFNAQLYALLTGYAVSM